MTARQARRPAQPAAAPPAHGPTARGFEDADGFYEQLLDAHQGLSREASEAFNARLVLLLAHEVGRAATLRDCINQATASAPDAPA